MADRSEPERRGACVSAVNSTTTASYDTASPTPPPPSPLLVLKLDKAAAAEAKARKGALARSGRHCRGRGAAVAAAAGVPSVRGQGVPGGELLLPQRLPDEPLAVLQPLIPNLGERERRLQSKYSEHEKK